VEDLADVLLAYLDVDRIHDHAGTERSPEGDQRFDPVVGEQGDPVAGTHALARQEIREAPGQRLELAEGDSRALVGALDEDLVRAAARVLLEEGVDVRERTRALSVQSRNRSTRPSRRPTASESGWRR
jgi:hypothetical protein